MALEDLEKFIEQIGKMRDKDSILFLHLPLLQCNLKTRFFSQIRLYEIYARDFDINNQSI